MAQKLIGFGRLQPSAIVQEQPAFASPQSGAEQKTAQEQDFEGQREKKDVRSGSARRVDGSPDLVGKGKAMYGGETS